MQGIIFCQQVNAVLIHADALPLGMLRQSAVQAAGQAELELPGVILQTVRHRNGYALFQCGLQPGLFGIPGIFHSAFNGLAAGQAPRQIATGRMAKNAEELGADAVVGMRYASASVMQGAAEVIAYGTAVKFV